MEDAEIVALYLARSEQALVETQAKYGSHCHAIALRLLGDNGEAEEAVNDALLAAWNAIPPHCPEKLSAFLGKLTRRNAVNRCLAANRIENLFGKGGLFVMEKLDLFYALGEVDDDILEDAEVFLHTSAKRLTPAWMKWGSLAACATLAVFAMWVAGRPINTTDPRISEEPSVSLSAAPSQEVGEPTVDAPVEASEPLTRPAVEMHFNELAEAPVQNNVSLFALMMEDFVPMTREELLNYYGVTLPVEELFPHLSAVGPEVGDGFGRGIYRRDDGEPYFDCNTFSFASADGVLGVSISLDKAFHLPASIWELPGNELHFTVVNGWELALFRYPDEEGNKYFYTEFCQNGVNYRVTGKGMCEQEYAVVLESLLEPREDFAPGTVRTVTGTVTAGISRQVLTSTGPDGGVQTEVTWRGPLGLTVDDGSKYPSLLVELTPEQAFQFAELSVGDLVTVRFIGEPATVGTLWPQQIVSLTLPTDPANG